METFLKLAYAKAIVEYLRRHLTDACLPGGTGNKVEIICQEAPFSHKEVPLEDISDFILRLQQEESIIINEMNKYSFVRKNVRRIAQSDDTRCIESRGSCVGDHRDTSTVGEPTGGGGDSESSE